jgi:hypothetical protein
MGPPVFKLEQRAILEMPDQMPFGFFNLVRVMVKPDTKARISIPMVFNRPIFAEFKKVHRVGSLSPTRGQHLRALKGMQGLTKWRAFKCIN